MITFSATVDGVEALNRGFNRIEQHISDFRSIWPEVAREIFAINREQLDSEGAAGASGKYAALSPAYQRFKAIQFPGQPILQASGDLYASLTDMEAPDAIFRPGKDELVIGSKVPYARAHQRGNPSRNLPARPIFSFSEPQKRRIQKAIQRGLVQFTRQAGFEVQEEKAA